MTRVALALALAASTALGGERTSKVNPFIGTGGHGHTFPGPSLPFGMIQPGPDTRLTGWDGCSGYHDSDRRIYGFSHTHLSGTGIPDYGDVLLMPMTGEPRLENGADGKPGYSSAFRKETEGAAPGYYAVTLDDPGIRVELTTSRRAAMHRYALPRGKDAWVVLDLAHRDEVIESSLRVVSDREIEGSRRSRAWAKDQRLFFVARFSRPFRPGPDEKNLKAALAFGKKGGPLLVKVGISAVDVEGARRNLEAEIPGWDFDGLRRAADVAWERELGKIRVEGGSRRQQVVFYTALYHSFLAPNLYTDVDGRYRGRDLEIHRANGFQVHTVFSLWDTFRALHPLLAIVDRARTRDFVKTFLKQYEEGGRLPVWELSANETDCMIGYHAVPVIADAILEGIGGFDSELAFEAMKASADSGARGLAGYERDGFISAQEEAESVSKTLEYAYDDWCIAEVAAKLGFPADEARYRRRAQAWAHLFDPSTGFMRARVEGHWSRPFDPSSVDVNYTEANAWQYSFFVPHDVEGLMRLHGGREAFARKLDALFTADSRMSGRDQSDITGLVGQYAHGNEPSHHMAYLYAFAGQPWKTQAMARRLMDEMYADAPDGLSGNEDCGQMSAWFVLSALGFYPVAPGSGRYVLGTPLFPRATIRLENGKSFVIRAPKVSEKAIHVVSARLDGRPWSKSWLGHEALADGGSLDLDMSETPDVEWASRPEDSPSAPARGPRVVPAPFVASGEMLFRESTAIALGDALPGATIRYTLDGREPDETSPAYASPIAVGASGAIRARAFAPGFEPSPIVSIGLHRLADGRAITLDARYSASYAAGGDLALVDGLRGGPDFRLGRWQGYLGKDLTAVVDLGRETEIHRLAMGFLQDMRSWILFPKRVSFDASTDGTVWRALGEVANDVSDREANVTIKAFELAVPGTRARWVRVRVAAYGPLPAWHPGSGEPSFFFADEIVVE